MNAGTIKLVKVLSWLLVITGLVYALKLFGILPMPHPECMWKKVHVFLGIITSVMCLWHCIDHWKWYKAWLNGRLRNNIRNVVLAKWTTLFFVLMIGILLLDWIWPSKLYAAAHIITAFSWMVIVSKHCKSKYGNNCRGNRIQSGYCRCR